MKLCFLVETKRPFGGVARLSVSNFAPNEGVSVPSGIKEIKFLLILKVINEIKHKLKRLKNGDGRTKHCVGGVMTFSTPQNN